MPEHPLKTMDFQQLANLTFGEIKPKLENHRGLSIFAKERAKFEGWLKVELCDSLSKYFEDIRPEDQRVDICFDDWGIELKTINTNIRYPSVKNKHRPITKNTQGIIDDIDKLSRLGFKDKGIIFVVFPIEHGNKNWQIQLKRITAKLRNIEFCSFYFKNEVAPGVIYFGAI